MTDYLLLPEHMREGTQAYFEQHREPGGFLRALLEARWEDARVHADPLNRIVLHAWRVWLETQAPADAWGSPEKVAAWLVAGQVRA